MMRKKLVPGLLIGILVLCITGCTRVARTIAPHSPIVCKEAEILVKAPFGSYQQRRLAVLPFVSPDYAPGVGSPIAGMYAKELLRSGFFHQVTVTEGDFPAYDDTALQYLAQDYELVMRGKVLYLLAGSGGTSTRVTVESQIIDPTLQVIVSYVRQEAESTPGPDVSFVWHTVPGETARPYLPLAEALGRQLAIILTSSPESGKEPVRPAVEPPFVTIYQ